MAAELVKVDFAPKAPAGLAEDLRRMADAVDRGEIVDLIATFVQDDCYQYLWGASLFQAVGLSAMLHAQAIHRMRDD